MKIVVFGLTISSSWGNGHATLWRGLCRALVRRGHRIVFFERDVPYYAANRDFHEIPGGTLILYDDWVGVRGRAEREIVDADAAIVTSYCPDAIVASELMLAASRPLKVFYDLDTPVTLSRLGRGEMVPYVSARRLADFDLVLSYAGGRALAAIRRLLGAIRVAPLYGHVDPQVHLPVAAVERYRADLSYLGTYAADRLSTLKALFVAPAHRRPDRRFFIGGAQYPQDFPWSGNIFFVRHLPPSEHAAFFSSSRLTLNVTRRDMAEMGWCPSGRLFEATACGAAVLSDFWDGFAAFFEPGREILLARTTDEVEAALDLTDGEISRVAKAGRERTLAEHTSERRATELISLFEQTRASETSRVAMEA
jgi:spore maturation protein CgeB